MLAFRQNNKNDLVSLTLLLRISDGPVPAEFDMLLVKKAHKNHKAVLLERGP